MATFKKSQFGGLSGKIGNIVIYERNGKQVVRSNPVQKDPKTPAQLAHRAKFSLANKGLSPLNKIIKIGYKNSEKNYRKLVGEAYHNAIIGEYPDFVMDYGKVQIAEGNLQLPANAAMKLEESSNVVNFSWDTQIKKGSQSGKPYDHVNIVCLNSTTLFAEHLFNAAKRSEGKASFEVPKSWEKDNLHFWIFLTSYDMEENSNSVYMG